MNSSPLFWNHGCGQSPRSFRTALGCYPTGVAIVTALSPNGRTVGLTINSFASVSMDPPLVLWSLASNSPSLASFEQCSHFAVNVLAEDQRDLCRQFANPSVIDKFAGVECTQGGSGLPLISRALAQFECRKERSFIGGDHVVFFGLVEKYQWRDALPLLFHAGSLIPLPQLEAA